MTTLCLADLELETCFKKHEPRAKTPSQRKLIEMLKAKPAEQGASNDSLSS